MDNAVIELGKLRSFVQQFANLPDNTRVIVQELPAVDGALGLSPSELSICAVTDSPLPAAG